MDAKKVAIAVVGGIVALNVIAGTSMVIKKKFSNKGLVKKSSDDVVVVEAEVIE